LKPNPRVIKDDDMVDGDNFFS
jgi:hypothetical protein